MNIISPSKSMRTLSSIKNWHLTDEGLAAFVLGLSIIFADVDFLYNLRGLAIVYLFMCVAFRKYESIIARHRDNTK